MSLENLFEFAVDGHLVASLISNDRTAVRVATCER
jgi:hypothetical protein